MLTLILIVLVLVLALAAVGVRYFTSRGFVCPLKREKMYQTGWEKEYDKGVSHFGCVMDVFVNAYVDDKWGGVSGSRAIEKKITEKVISYRLWAIETTLYYDISNNTWEMWVSKVDADNRRQVTKVSISYREAKKILRKAARLTKEEYAALPEVRTCDTCNKPMIEGVHGMHYITKNNVPTTCGCCTNPRPVVEYVPAPAVVEPKEYDCPRCGKEKCLTKLEREHQDYCWDCMTDHDLACSPW